MTRLAASEARDHFADVLNRVAFGRERVILERRGKDLAALVSLDDLKILEALEDHLDIQDALAALAEGEQEGFIPWEDIRNDLKL